MRTGSAGGPADRERAMENESNFVVIGGEAMNDVKRLGPLKYTKEEKIFGGLVRGFRMLGNKMEGHTHGVEAWGGYRPLEWWRLSLGYNYLKKRLRFESDSSDTVLRNAGNDPAHQFSARSAMNLGRRLELDAAVRFIGGLPDPNVPSYTALDARLGWTVMEGLEISLTGFKLLDRRHPEFGKDPTGTELDRTVYARMRWNL